MVTRADDNAEAIETRIDAFIKETVPAIEMYNEKMIKIDGEPIIEEVEQAAYEVLDPILNK